MGMGMGMGTILNNGYGYGYGSIRPVPAPRPSLLPSHHLPHLPGESYHIVVDRSMQAREP